MPQVLSTLVAPEATQVDQAYQFSTVLAGGAPATAGVTYKVVGNAAEVVLLVAASYTADGTAGTRFPELLIEDSQGVAYAFALAAVGQGPTSSVPYTWSAQLTSGYGSATAGQMLPLPAIVLPPTWKVVLSVSNAQGAGDAFGSVSVVTVKLPSGMPQVEPVVPVPTPILL